MKGADRCPYRRAVENSYFEKAFLINLIMTYSKLLNIFIYARFLQIKEYEQGALRKELIFAPFVERFKRATSRKSS